MMMCFFSFFFDRKNDIVHKYEIITLCISTNRNFIFSQICINRRIFVQFIDIFYSEMYNIYKR